MQTEAAPRRLHITDVTETGWPGHVSAPCTRQEVGCQTVACQTALAGSAVVSGGLLEGDLEPAAVSGGVRPTRSGDKQRNRAAEGVAAGQTTTRRQRETA